VRTSNKLRLKIWVLFSVSFMICLANIDNDNYETELLPTSSAVSTFSNSISGDIIRLEHNVGAPMSTVDMYIALGVTDNFHYEITLADFTFYQFVNYNGFTEWFYDGHILPYWNGFKGNTSREFYTRPTYTIKGNTTFEYKFEVFDFIPDLGNGVFIDDRAKFWFNVSCIETNENFSYSLWSGVNDSETIYELEALVNPALQVLPEPMILTIGESLFIIGDGNPSVTYLTHEPFKAQVLYGVPDFNSFMNGNTSTVTFNQTFEGIYIISRNAEQYYNETLNHFFSFAERNLKIFGGSVEYDIDQFFINLTYAGFEPAYENPPNPIVTIREVGTKQLTTNSFLVYDSSFMNNYTIDIYDTTGLIYSETFDVTLDYVVHNINLGSEYVFPGFPRDVFFSIFDTFGVGIPAETVKFFINGSRSDLGDTLVFSDQTNITILDFFDNILYQEIVTINGFRSIDIEIPVFNLILTNNFTEPMIVEIERADRILTTTIPGKSSIEFQFLSNLEYTIRWKFIDGELAEEVDVLLDENNIVVSFSFFEKEVTDFDISFETITLVDVISIGLIVGILSAIVMRSISGRVGTRIGSTRSVSVSTRKNKINKPRSGYDIFSDSGFK